MIGYLIILAIILCVLVAFLIYHSKAHSAIKLASLPMVIFFCIAMIYYMIAIAGAPIQGLPTGEWEYQAHIPENKGKTIILWAWIKRFEDYRHYRFPYSRKTMKKLNEAREKAKMGRKIKGKFQKSLKGENELFISEGTPRDAHNPLKDYEVQK